MYILVALLGFFCETVDSSLGMGYGTILTPVLLFIGFEPLEIVPLVLISEFFTGILSALMHHRKGNVNLQPGSRALKVAVILGACSIVGTVTAVYLASLVSPLLVKAYIAFLLLLIGVSSYLTSQRKHNFSWAKIFGLGLVASFNKGVSGGGYGPLITGGQLLSGVNGKNAVGITSLSEGLTCFIGIIAYLLISPVDLNWKLALALIPGALLSIPVSVQIVNKINENIFKRVISLSILLLGIFTFYKTFSSLIVTPNLPLVLAAVIITVPFAYQWGKHSLNNAPGSRDQDHHQAGPEHQA